MSVNPEHYCGPACPQFESPTRFRTDHVGPSTSNPTVPRRGYLMRHDDVSGVSGTGVVAWMVMFADGVIAMRWCVKGKPMQTAIWSCLEDMVAIHGHGGATEIVWID